MRGKTGLRLLSAPGCDMRTQYEGYILGSSNKAVLFHGHYWEAPAWIPFSQCEIIEDEDSYIVTISHWLASRKKIPEFTYMDEAAMEEANAY